MKGDGTQGYGTKLHDAFGKLTGVERSKVYAKNKHAFSMDTLIREGLINPDGLTDDGRAALDNYASALHVEVPQDEKPEAATKPAKGKAPNPTG